MRSITMDSAFVPPVWKRTTAASASTCRGGGRRVTRALPCSYRSGACTHSIGVASSRFASSLPCSPSFRPTCKTSVFRFLAVARATGRSEHHVVAVSRPEEVECDVCIVGGGPAGCTCALYTSRAELKTIVLDKNNTTGALAITSTIANYPGVDKTMPGQQLLNEMQKQAEDFGTDYRRAQVFLVDVQGEYKYVYTPDATFKARALVLSTGAMGRKPSFKGEDTYLGRGVSYCATCDGAFYRDEEVVVTGVTQEAVEEAQYLTKFASKVHWVTGKDVSGVPFADDLLACSNVRQWENSRLISIQGDDSGVTGVTLKQRGQEEEEKLATRGVFVYVAGQLPITDFCQASGVEFNVEGNHESGVKVNEEMATNVAGVYAIGDIRNTPYKQVVVAAADGCIAAMAIDKYLKGRKKIRVDWVHE